MTIDEILTEKSANLYKRNWNQEKRLWVYAHREALGLSEKDRHLVVHHKDDDETNFDPSNLVALTRAEHAKIGRPALKHEKCKICGKPHFARALCLMHYMREYRKEKRKKALHRKALS